MKVGDLVAITELNEEEVVCWSGVVLSLSRTGRMTKSAEVMFNSGDISWVDCHLLEVISESR